MCGSSQFVVDNIAAITNYNGTLNSLLVQTRDSNFKIWDKQANDLIASAKKTKEGKSVEKFVEKNLKYGPMNDTYAPNFMQMYFTPKDVSRRGVDRLCNELFDKVWKKTTHPKHCQAKNYKAQVGDLDQCTVVNES